MTSTLEVPTGDRFQIISEHENTRFVIDPHYLGIERPAEAGIIQVTPNTPEGNLAMPYPSAVEAVGGTPLVELEAA